MPRKLTHAEIAKVRAAIGIKQGGHCPLCGSRLGSAKQPVLDHCHTRGYIRGVLCRNCNGMEGKLFNIARRAQKDDPLGWVKRLLDYHEFHATPKWGHLIHPLHKTEAEKRLARNKKAREKRAALKAQKD